MNGGDVGARARALRERRGWSFAQAARRADLDPSTIWKIERGKTPNPGTETLRKLAAAYEVELVDLTGAQPLPRPRVEISEGVAKVPLMTLRVQAGEPVWDDSQAEILVRSGRDFRGRPNAFAAIVSGHCMEPEISAEDTVYVDPDRQPEDGELVVVTVPGGGTLVKWLAHDQLGRTFLRAADGTEIRPNGAKIEGVVFLIEKKPRRDPNRGRRLRAAEEPFRY